MTARDAFVASLPSIDSEVLLDTLISSARQLGAASTIQDRLDHSDEVRICKTELLSRLV